jgi:mannose-6-phosphate isomerase-like protein (cupin superfamily)
MNNYTDFDCFFRGTKTSQITEEFPDKTKFPLYYEAKRQEFILNPGEMLYIPSKWWHFVFSEDIDPVTHINFAVNFWYVEPDDDIEYNETPYIKKHNLPNVDPIMFLKDDILQVIKSKTNYFVPGSISHIFESEQHEEKMKYTDFLKERDPHSYIVQKKVEEFDKYAPKHHTGLLKSNFWINFGNVLTSPHYDCYDNWLCQLQGKKRVILFYPEEGSKMYPLNNCSLKLMNKITKIWNDQFIVHRLRTLTDCKYIIQEPLLEYTTSDRFFSSFNSITEIIKRKLIENNCIIPIFPLPKKFKVIDARCSEHTVVKFMETPYTIVWFMTSGKLYVRSYAYDVKEGDCYAFPSSFMYPWKVQGAVFVMPDPTTSSYH